MATVKIALVKAFLVTRLIWQFLFFSKTAMCAFIVISYCTKLGHGTTIVLLTTNSTFYEYTKILELQLTFLC